GLSKAVTAERPAERALHLPNGARRALGRRVRAFRVRDRGSRGDVVQPELGRVRVQERQRLRGARELLFTRRRGYGLGRGGRCWLSVRRGGSVDRARRRWRRRGGRVGRGVRVVAEAGLPPTSTLAASLRTWRLVRGTTRFVRGTTRF